MDLARRMDRSFREAPYVNNTIQIHDNGILKAQEGARYNFLEGQELENLIVAMRIYYEEVARNIYKRDPQTGQPLQSAAVTPA